jgi:hypothetical protein
MGMKGLYDRVSKPKNIFLNWFIPAFVKSMVGSCAGINDELSICACCFDEKKEKNFSRISVDCIMSFARI